MYTLTNKNNVPFTVSVAIIKDDDNNLMLHNVINSIEKFMKNINKDELRLEFMTKENNRQICFVRIYLHKIIINNNEISHYDIVGNADYVPKEGVKINLSEDLVIRYFKEQIVPKIFENIKDPDIRKAYAFKYFSDDRKYLHKNGKFCPYDMPTLNEERAHLQKLRFEKIFDIWFDCINNLICNESYIVDEKIKNISLPLSSDTEKMKNLCNEIFHNIHEMLYNDENDFNISDLENIQYYMNLSTTKNKKISFVLLIYSIIKFKRLSYLYIINTTEVRKSMRRMINIIKLSIGETNSNSFVQYFFECKDKNLKIDKKTNTKGRGKRKKISE